MWDTSKLDFLKIARGTSLGYFIAQFEREDAERQAVSRHRHLSRGGPAAE
jgi:hypothetical protein